jgi:hypothetical protein
MRCQNSSLRPNERGCSTSRPEKMSRALALSEGGDTTAHRLGGKSEAPGASEGNGRPHCVGGKCRGSLPPLEGKGGLFSISVGRVRTRQVSKGNSRSAGLPFLAMAAPPTSTPLSATAVRLIGIPSDGCSAHSLARPGGPALFQSQQCWHLPFPFPAMSSALTTVPGHGRRLRWQSQSGPVVAVGVPHRELLVKRRPGSLPTA